MLSKRLRVIVSSLGILAMLIGLMPAQMVAAVPPASPATAATQQPDQPDSDTPIGTMIDIGPKLRADKNIQLETMDLPEGSFLTMEGAYGVGDSRIFAVLDDAFGKYRYQPYNVRLISNKVEVWVQNDLNYYNSTDGKTFTLNPTHPDALDPEYITQERIEALASAVEDVIIPKDIEFFGAYTDRDGSDSPLAEALGAPADYYAGPAQRLIVLVSNVRDDNFYDPMNNPSFIAGFYSPSYNYFANRNIITIDSKQWNTRAGAPNYDYEATIAHELQHLINGDWDGNEETWANEGRSEFAEFLMGYRIGNSDAHRTQWSDFPENSLTVWEDQSEDADQKGYELLADYQQAYWFMLYLTGRLMEDKPGLYSTVEEYFKEVTLLTSDPKPGAASIDAMLKNVKASFTFDELWQDFRTDMLYGGTSDETTWGSYISQYIGPSGATTAPLDLGRLRDNLNFEGYDTPGAPPYGSDYIEIGWSSTIVAGTAINFSMPPTAAPTGWSVVSSPVDATGHGNVLYSGHTNLNDNFLILPISDVKAGDVLSFDTLYDIEQTWDYGFVQVTTDTAKATGFTSLGLTGMIDEVDLSGHPIIQANVPGFSGTTTSSDGKPIWVTVTANLSAYAGNNILLAFRYSTDWGSAGNGLLPKPGWYLDNLKMNGTSLYSSETELPASAMSIYQAREEPPQPLVDFVTFEENNGKAIKNVHPLVIDGTGNGTFDLSALVTSVDEGGFDEAGERVVAVVSVVPPALDADLISVPSTYQSYTLAGLPPTLYTSRTRITGTSSNTSVTRPRVYPGDTIKVTTTLDNLGRTGEFKTHLDWDPTAYVAMPLPANTSYVAGSVTASLLQDNAVYVTDLSTKDSALPAVPGIYWYGTVYYDENLSDVTVSCNLMVSAPLAVDTTMITPEVYIANAPFNTAPTGPSQNFTALETAAQVVSPFALSTVTSAASTIRGQVATFTYTIINTDDVERDIDFRFTVPANTTLENVSDTTGPLSGLRAADQVIPLTVPAYTDTTKLVTTVQVDLRTGTAFDYKTQTLDPGAVIYQPGSDLIYTQPASIPMLITMFNIYMPVLRK